MGRPMNSKAKMDHYEPKESEDNLKMKQHLDNFLPIITPSTETTELKQLSQSTKISSNRLQKTNISL